MNSEASCGCFCERHYPNMSILLSVKKNQNDWVVTGFKMGLRLDASKALE